jgi:NAD-dependent dihydropyrimidine dehydrogenase PreA subunit
MHAVSGESGPEAEGGCAAAVEDVTTQDARKPGGQEPAFTPARARHPGIPASALSSDHRTLFAAPFEANMPYVITEACINTKDKACVDVCPVDCIYEGPDQLFIHPDECIDCGACEPECPVTAIFPEEDVPAQLKQYIQLNRDVFKSDNPPGRPTR